MRRAVLICLFVQMIKVGRLLQEWLEWLAIKKAYQDELFEQPIYSLSEVAVGLSASAASEPHWLMRALLDQILIFCSPSSCSG